MTPDYDSTKYNGAFSEKRKKKGEFIDKSLDVITSRPPLIVTIPKLSNTLTADYQRRKLHHINYRHAFQNPNVGSSSSAS